MLCQSSLDELGPQVHHGNRQQECHLQLSWQISASRLMDVWLGILDGHHFTTGFWSVLHLSCVCDKPSVKRLSQWNKSHDTRKNTVGKKVGFAAIPLSIS